MVYRYICVTSVGKKPNMNRNRNHNRKIEKEFGIDDAPKRVRKSEQRIREWERERESAQLKCAVHRLPYIYLMSSNNIFTWYTQVQSKAMSSNADYMHNVYIHSFNHNNNCYRLKWSNQNNKCVFWNEPRKKSREEKKRVSMLDSCRQPNTNTNTYTNRISSNCSNNSPNCVTTQCSYSIWIKTREKKNWENPEILDSDDVFFPFEFDCTGYENVESCEREWAHLCVLFLSSSFLIFFSVLISDHSSDATQSSVK